MPKIILLGQEQEDMYDTQELKQILDEKNSCSSIFGDGMLTMIGLGGARSPYFLEKLQL
jgi:hypothetical protein